MSLLTDNIRWVHAITLEGNRITADGLVVRRDMVAGARIDRFGMRGSFIIAIALLVLAVGFSISAFLETLQFFDPNYTIFALSLLPVLVLGAVAWIVRPQQHFTVLLRDGSAIAIRSADGHFLNHCLEAFERLWADPAKDQASLYLHGIHRSVDFGPPSNGLELVATASSEPNDTPINLPVFEPELADDEPLHDPSPPKGPPPFEPGDDVPFEPPAKAPAIEIADNDEDDGADLPPLPPPPSQPDSDHENSTDDAAEPGSDEDRGEDEVEPQPLRADEEPKPIDAIPASTFAPLRPKIEALVRLLRERGPTEGLSDAVDVLELMTRRGASNPREVRALSRALDVLSERMDAYPTAVALLEQVRTAGALPRSRPLTG